MDKKLKTKWVTALRSGEYRQGGGQLLGSDGTYCCLGVLCRVAGATEDEIRLRGYPEDVPGYEGLIPHEIARSLARLNDTSHAADDRVPFEVIAGLIHHEL